MLVFWWLDLHSSSPTKAWNPHPLSTGLSDSSVSQLVMWSQTAVNSLQEPSELPEQRQACGQRDNVTDGFKPLHHFSITSYLFISCCITKHNYTNHTFSNNSGEGESRITFSTLKSVSEKKLFWQTVFVKAPNCRVFSKTLPAFEKTSLKKSDFLQCRMKSTH